MKKTETLYIKRVSENGRVRYQPIAERFPEDTFTEGTWVVVSTPGVKAIAKAITPSNPELAVILNQLRNLLISKLMKPIQPATESNYIVITESAWHIVNASIDEVLEELKIK